MTTARDAILDVLAEERDAHPWVIQTTPMIVSVVLAVLGIPPEMSVDDVTRAISTHVQTRAWQERVIAEERDLAAADQEDTDAPA